jgi:hypothetical protein
VSVDKKGKFPSTQAVELVMQEFEMGNNIHDCEKVWIEDHRAINVVRKME